jgi:phosphopentomutase
VRRAFVIVLDACGVGALPDADSYGDAGTNTLGHLAELTALAVPNLQSLGLGSILPLDGVAPAEHPVLHGRLRATGYGKDSTAGHWELMGVTAGAPPPTYPRGFPPEVIDLVCRASGRQIICNRPYNGIDAIDDFGGEHLRSGSLIVYTSQDSVLQIAAHIDVVPAAELYEICAQVRAELPPEHAVGRVIARPFEGDPGKFARTDGRRDLALPPPQRSYLDALHDLDIPVHSVGKVGQLFAGRGIDEQHPGATNAVALEQTGRLISSLPGGFVFTNLIETDQVYGHRHDVSGFASALAAIDTAVGEWLKQLGEDDLLVLTADHGCDPAASHTDHTREFVPLLAVYGEREPRRHQGQMAEVGASVLRWLTGREAADLPGRSFL